MREYGQLPNQPFATRADAVDPVTVRTLVTGEGQLFYAVNRERYAVKMQIALNRPGKARRLSTGEDIPSNGKSIPLELKPYQLIVARLEPGVDISAVSANVPQAERKLVEDRLSWVRRLAASKRLGPGAEKVTLDAAVAEASAAVRQDRLWHARTVLEHNSLLAIYRRLDCYPSNLFADQPGPLRCEP
jgi:hypothetical protein